MGSWIHDGFLDSWNPCVKDFRILDLLESIIGFNKSFVQWAGIEVKNKKLMPIYTHGTYSESFRFRPAADIS